MSKKYNDLESRHKALERKQKNFTIVSILLVLLAIGSFVAFSIFTGQNTNIKDLENKVSSLSILNNNLSNENTKLDQDNYALRTTNNHVQQLNKALNDSITSYKNTAPKLIYVRGNAEFYNLCSNNFTKNSCRYSGSFDEKYTVYGYTTRDGYALTMLGWVRSFDWWDIEQVQGYDISQIARDFIKAEESRNFEKIYTFFSNNIIRYYDSRYPTYEDLKKSYQKSWDATTYASNNIHAINVINSNNLNLKTSFTYKNNSMNQARTIISNLHFTFDDKGKITEIYTMN